MPPTKLVGIIGGGPAGLATAAELGRRGVPYLVFERGPTLGHTWANLYDSLTLHTGKHMSTLPGRPYDRGVPLFPTRRDFLDYLVAYARENNVVVRTDTEIVRVERVANGWSLVERSGNEIVVSDLVVATGIVANPVMPSLPGQEHFRGRVMHAVDYHRPNDFVGKRVLVVGVGNSGGEIGGELARAGALVTVSVRSGAYVVPKTIGPFPAQYVRYVLGMLPRFLQEWIMARVRARLTRKFGPPVFPFPSHHPLDGIPLIGFSLVDAIRAGMVQVKLSAPTAFATDGVQFADGTSGTFDVVLFATGYRAAVDFFTEPIRKDARGFALRSDRVRSADLPNLYFVGHSYDHTGGLTNIRRDAVLAAKSLASHPSRGVDATRSAAS